MSDEKLSQTKSPDQSSLSSSSESTPNVRFHKTLTPSDLGSSQNTAVKEYIQNDWYEPQSTVTPPDITMTQLNAINLDTLFDAKGAEINPKQNKNEHTQINQIKVFIGQLFSDWKRGLIIVGIEPYEIYKKRYREEMHIEDTNYVPPDNKLAFFLYTDLANNFGLDVANKLCVEYTQTLMYGASRLFVAPLASSFRSGDNVFFPESSEAQKGKNILTINQDSFEFAYSVSPSLQVMFNERTRDAIKQDYINGVPLPDSATYTWTLKSDFSDNRGFCTKTIEVSADTQETLDILIDGIVLPQDKKQEIIASVNWFTNKALIGFLNSLSSERSFYLKTTPLEDIESDSFEQSVTPVAKTVSAVSTSPEQTSKLSVAETPPESLNAPSTEQFSAAATTSTLIPVAPQKRSISPESRAESAKAVNTNISAAANSAESHVGTIEEPSTLLEPVENNRETAEEQTRISPSIEQNATASSHTNARQEAVSPPPSTENKNAELARNLTFVGLGLLAIVGGPVLIAAAAAGVVLVAPVILPALGIATLVVGAVAATIGIGGLVASAINYFTAPPPQPPAPSIPETLPSSASNPSDIMGDLGGDLLSDNSPTELSSSIGASSATSSLPTTPDRQGYESGGSTSEDELDLLKDTDLFDEGALELPATPTDTTGVLELPTKKQTSTDTAGTTIITTSSPPKYHPNLNLFPPQKPVASDNTGTTTPRPTGKTGPGK